MTIVWKLLEQWAKNMQRESDRFKVTFTIGILNVEKIAESNTNPAQKMYINKCSIIQVVSKLFNIGLSERHNIWFAKYNFWLWIQLILFSWHQMKSVVIYWQKWASPCVGGTSVCCSKIFTRFNSLNEQTIMTICVAWLSLKLHVLYKLESKKHPNILARLYVKTFVVMLNVWRCKSHI